MFLQKEKRVLLIHTFVKTSTADPQFNQVFGDFLSYCRDSQAHWFDAKYVNDFVIEARDSLLSLKLLDEGQIHFVQSIQSFETRFFEANYWQVFCDVYSPILWLSASTPLLSLVTFHSFNRPFFKKMKGCGQVLLFTFTGVSATAMVLYLTAIKPRFLRAWEWRAMDPGFLEKFRFDYTVWISNEVPKYMIDLDGINQTQLDFMVHQINHRLGPTIHGIYSMTSCGFMSQQFHENHLQVIAQIFFDFRNQYIELSKYGSYPDIYCFVLIPYAMVLATHLLVCKF